MRLETFEHVRDLHDASRVGPHSHPQLRKRNEGQCALVSGLSCPIPQNSLPLPADDTGFPAPGGPPVAPK